MVVGSILGLSVLARDSELIVMRAAGVSIQRIVLSVLKVGMVLALADGQIVHRSPVGPVGISHQFL